MYHGSNPTARASQGWLAAALLGLMEHKPYPQISVREICAAAGLSRQTFYNVFDSKDEILRYRIWQCYDEMIGALRQQTAPTVAGITRLLAQTFQNDRGFFQLLLDQHLEFILYDELFCAIRRFTEQVNLRASYKHDSAYGAAFLTGALVSTILCWFKDEDPISPEELAALLSDILAGDYYTIQLQ